MSYLRRPRGGDEDVDDFEEYDPTPYGGGYDQVRTYGEPIPPSEDTCYPISSSGDDNIDYGRPQYSSYSQTSCYEGDYDAAARYGVSQPKPAFVPDEAGDGSFGRPQPNYGSRPGTNRLDYETGGPAEYSYGSRPGSEESGVGYGSGFGGRPKREESRPSYGYGGGDSDRPSRFGEDYPPPRRPGGEDEGGESGFGYGSGFGGKPKREEDRPSYKYGGDSDRPGRFVENFPPPGRYGGGEGGEYGYGGRTERSEYERPSYERPDFERPSWQAEEPPRRPSYGISSYERQEEEEPRRFQESSYYNPDQAEGYGSRPKNGNDSDDEEKKRRHHKHHHHRKYDDDE